MERLTDGLLGGRSGFTSDAGGLSAPRAGHGGGRDGTTPLLSFFEQKGSVGSPESIAAGMDALAGQMGGRTSPAAPDPFGGGTRRGRVGFSGNLGDSLMGSEGSVHSGGGQFLSSGSALQALLGDDGEDDDAKRYRIEKVDLKTTCCFKVGTSGQKMCLEATECCSFSTHNTDERRDRFDDASEPGWVWVVVTQTSRSRVFFEDPVLSVAVAERVADFDQFTDELLTLDKWAEVFRLVEMTAAAPTKSQAEYRTELLARSVRKAARTPLIRRKTERGGDDEMSDRLEYVEDSVLELDGNLQGLESRVGDITLEGVEYPSVMAAMRSVASASSSNLQAATRKVVEPMRQDVVRLKGQVVGAAADLRMWAKRYETATASVPSSHDVQMVEAEGRKSFATLQKVVPMLVNMGKRLSTVEQNGSNRKVQGTTPAGSTQPTAPSALECEVKFLRAELDTLKASGDKASVEMGGVPFRSKQDCRAFLMTKGPPGAETYQLYSTPSLALCRAADGVSSSEDSSKQLTESARSGKSRPQQQQIATCTMAYPVMFTGGKGHDASVEGSPLCRIDTTVKWNGTDGMSGVTNEVQRRVSSEVGAMSAEISAALSLYPELALVTNSMLTQSVAYVQSLSLEMLSFHAYLVLSTKHRAATSGAAGSKLEKAHDQECWELVLKMVQTILETVAAPLQEVKNAWSAGDPLDVSSAYMWASLQSLRAWKDFQEARWRSHPLISPQVTLYLFQNRASKTEVASMREEMQALKKRSDDLARQLAQAETQIGKVAGDLKHIKAGKK